MLSTQSKSSSPEWLVELIKMRDSRDRSAGEWPPLRGTDYGHFVSVYKRIVAAQDVRWRSRSPFEQGVFIRNSLNSRILYASQGRPVATQHLEEVWNIFITEKLIS